MSPPPHGSRPPTLPMPPRRTAGVAPEASRPSSLSFPSSSSLPLLIHFFRRNCHGHLKLARRRSSGFGRRLPDPLQHAVRLGNSMSADGCFVAVWPPTACSTSVTLVQLAGVRAVRRGPILLPCASTTGKASPVPLSTSMVSSVVRGTLVIWHDHPDERLWSLVLQTVVNHYSPYRFGHSVHQLQSEGEEWIMSVD
ncbi:uncharacterized protein [Triticum aestivum]|uniref:uncharacterized protein n=1 Tax=Triticum aestivum TaxID=4565 RepID=UPI001D00E86C|nr:uncharacterized protein LOC123185201 [Triticum aestivum]